jgi:two-component system LytT family response regulator
MPPLKAIIIDDEPNAVTVLEVLLKTYCPNITIAGATNQSPEGVKMIREHTPDVVFLDIEMPQLNGFQVLDLVADIHFSLIFTTAYDQYALRAFKHSAIDYLMKPIDVDDLVKAVSKIGKKPHQEQLSLLHQSLQTKNAPMDRIALPGLKSVAFQAIADIVYCEANNTYTNFILANGQSLMISRPLGEYEELLSGSHFFRVHRQYLVNTKRIKELIKSDGGSVLMDNGAELPVARNRKQELLDCLGV